MFLLRPPAPVALKQLLHEQHALPFSYDPVGGTRTEIPPGYVVDHNEIVLGEGKAVFLKAVRALREWRMFDMPWLSLWPQDAPIQEGQTVAVTAQHFGVWSVNVARIHYVIDEQVTQDEQTVHRFGFGYGTLPAHAMMGEERFLVEWDEADDTVVYEVIAYSKPRHILARIGYPLARHLQKQFGPASLGAVRRAVRKRSL